MWRVDQARHQDPAAEVDDLGARARLWGGTTSTIRSSSRITVNPDRIERP